MSAETHGRRSRSGDWRRRFREWRWQRPFWAGLLALLAGLPIAYFPYANLTLGQLSVRMATTAGSGSLIIGVLLVTLGLTMWFQAAVRVFAGVATILLSLVSLVVSNVGGFLVGFLLGLIGGALAIAWSPGKPQAQTPAEETEEPEAPQPRPQDGFGAADGAFNAFETNGRHSAG
jgi:Family of unknown function (DUF6114)